MICKHCKNEIPDYSIYCLYCGVKLIREKKSKKDITVPAPRQLASGNWFIQLRKENASITAETSEECTLKAKAIRAGFLEAEKRPAKLTLKQVITQYIDNNDGVLDPSTICGYDSILSHRFADYMDKDINTIDFQKMVNEEAKKKSAKTVRNAWGLVSASLRAAKFDVPEVNTPRVPIKDGDFLDYKQIKVFLEAIKGDPAELPAILALHSLRLSEIAALTVDSISGGFIHVRGAVVRGRSGYVAKETNKNDSSTRDIPVMIPRLYELLPESGQLLTISRSALIRGIKRICLENNLPLCSVHDLRRSFASLAFHLKWTEITTQKIGGWSDRATVTKVYEKLSALDRDYDIKRMKTFYSSQSKPKKQKTASKSTAEAG